MSSCVGPDLAVVCYSPSEVECGSSDAKHGREQTFAGHENELANHSLPADIYDLPNGMRASQGTGICSV